MSQEVFKKKYNLTFNPDSIQGKITWGLFTIGFLGFFMILYPLSVYLGINEKQEFVLRHIIQIQYYCGKLENHIDEATSAVQDYLITDDKIYTERYESLWQNECKSDMDSLMTYATKNNEDPATAALVYDLVTRTKRIYEEQKKLIKTHNDMLIDQINQTEIKQNQMTQLEALHLITDDIRNILELIISVQENAILKTNTENKFSQKRMVITFGIIVIFVTVFSALMGTYIITSILDKIRILKTKLKELEMGNIPDWLVESNDEFKAMSRSINYLIAQMRHLQNFAAQISRHELNGKLLAYAGQGEMGSSLQEMQNSLQDLAKNEQLRAWASEGLLHFNKLLREGRNSGESVLVLAEKLISDLVKYIKVAQGGIYLVKKGQNDQPYLELIAFYAYDRKKYLNRRFEIGEGMVGEALREKNRIYIDQLPPDYIKLSSGLGATSPRVLLIVPMIANDEVQALFEITSLKPLTEHEIELIDKLAEVTAGTLLSMQNLERTNDLLQEAQRNSEKLRTQEEEMRQNLEELQATQEEMIRKEAEILKLLNQAEDREKQLALQLREAEMLRQQVLNQQDQMDKLKEEEKLKLNEAYEEQKRMLEKITLKFDSKEFKFKTKIKELEDLVVELENKLAEKQGQNPDQSV